MNINKKWITAAAVLTLSGSLAFAQQADQPRNGGFGHGRARPMNFARLAHKLNLTPEQKAQFREQQKSFHEANRAFFDSYRQNVHDMRDARQSGDTAKADALKATLESQRTQMQQLRKEQMEKFQSVLTAEQRAQLDELRAKRRERQQQRQ